MRREEMRRLTRQTCKPGSITQSGTGVMKSIYNLRVYIVIVFGGRRGGGRGSVGGRRKRILCATDFRVLELLISFIHTYQSLKISRGNLFGLPQWNFNRMGD
jgi:hypothetical protein